MNKTELVEAIASNTNMTKTDVATIQEWIDKEIDRKMEE